MKIRLGYDIAFETPREVAMVALLHVHPSRVPDLLEPDELETSDGVVKDEYVDSFGNRCTRLVAPPGELALRASTLIEDSGQMLLLNYTYPPDVAGQGNQDVAIIEDKPFEFLVR